MRLPRRGGVVVAPDGELIAVSDVASHRVLLFDGQRHYIKSFGRLGTGPGQFVSPGATIDSQHRIWVVDGAAGRRAAVHEGRQVRQRRSPARGAARSSWPGREAPRSARTPASSTSPTSAITGSPSGTRTGIGSATTRAAPMKGLLFRAINQRRGRRRRTDVRRRHEPADLHPRSRRPSARDDPVLPARRRGDGRRAGLHGSTRRAACTSPTCTSGGSSSSSSCRPSGRRPADPRRQSSGARGYVPRIRTTSVSSPSAASASAQAGSAGSASRSTQNRYSQREPRSAHGRDSSRDRLSPRVANAPERPVQRARHVADGEHQRGPRRAGDGGGRGGGDDPAPRRRGARRPRTACGCPSPTGCRRRAPRGRRSTRPAPRRRPPRPARRARRPAAPRRPCCTTSRPSTGGTAGSRRPGPAPRRSSRRARRSRAARPAARAGPAAPGRTPRPRPAGRTPTGGRGSRGSCPGATTRPARRPRRATRRGPPRTRHGTRTTARATGAAKKRSTASSAKAPGSPV